MVVTVAAVVPCTIGGMKKQGLGMSSLNVVFTALVVSRIEYALPSFSGFLSRANIDRLNAALRKARR